MAISPQRLTIYLYSTHRAVIFAIAQLSCYLGYPYIPACEAMHADSTSRDVDSNSVFAYSEYRHAYTVTVYTDIRRQVSQYGPWFLLMSPSKHFTDIHNRIKFYHEQVTSTKTHVTVSERMVKLIF